MCRLSSVTALLFSFNHITYNFPIHIFQVWNAVGGGGEISQPLLVLSVVLIFPGAHTPWGCAHEPHARVTGGWRRCTGARICHSTSEGSEPLEQAVQRSCCCPFPGKARPDEALSHLVSLAHGRGVGTRQSLRSFPTQTILHVYASMSSPSPLQFLSGNRPHLQPHRVGMKVLDTQITLCSHHLLG